MVPVLPASRRARTIAALGVCAALLVAGTAAPPSQAVGVAPPVRLCTSEPFRADPAHHVYWRIPAVVRTTAGTLLAFAERRRSTAVSSDSGDNDVAVVRSTDAGCSWSAPEVIAAHGTDTVGNPSPVVDAATGDVLLLTSDTPQGSSSLHGLHVQRSTDDGQHFTSYGTSGYDMAGRPGWSGGLTGPGHALQLASGDHAGRIVVPITVSRDGRRGASLLLSDDGGATWRVGLVSVGADRRQEGTAAQLADGRVWLSYREQSSSTPIGKARLAGLSSDGGDSLSTAFTRVGPPTPAVQGSALVLTGTHAGELLFSSPAGRGSEPSRRIMTIFTARTAVPGTSWTRYPVTLDDTTASYSDLVQVDDTTVGVLYEAGATDWHHGITFRSVRISALTAGPTVRPTVRVGLPRTAHARATLWVNVRVAVRGTASPAGSVRVTVSKKHWSRTVTKRLLFPGKGFRAASFATMPKGTYTVTTTYLGTPRIASSRVVSKLRVR